MYIYPFSYSWLVKINIDNKKIKSILELGCGSGFLGDLVNDDKKYNITGVDIFQPYLQKSKEKGKYFRLLKGDLTKKLTFRNRSFDAVICLQTIEHLSKEKGISLISQMEEIAKDLIIISTPNGECSQEEYDDNKHQRHLSTWSVEDFEKKGYKVYGIGLKWVYGTHSHVTDKYRFFKLPLYFFSFLMNPLVNIFPNLACQLVAIKLKQT